MYTLSELTVLLLLFVGDLTIEPDWLTESMPLHTPDEQDGDITFAPDNIYSMSLSLSPEPSQPSTPLFTPHTPLSIAHSPLSTSPDVEEVLSLFSDHSNDSTDFTTANEYLLFDDLSSVHSYPDLTPVNSPPVYYYPQQEALEDTQSPDPQQEEVKRKVKNKPRRKLTQTAKKERKRLQNKTAALRYRQKKKEEKCGSTSQLDILESKNTELKNTVSQITAEINYLKKLWSEVHGNKQLKPLSIC